VQKKKIVILLMGRNVKIAIFQHIRTERFIVPSKILLSFSVTAACCFDTNN